MSRTLVIIKPGYILQKNLLGKVFDILERNNLRMIKAKMVKLNTETVKQFYQEHKTAHFFSSLVEFMSNSLVFVSCWEGEDSINLLRKIIVATNPQESNPGTIRRMFGENIERNSIHASENEQAAKREIDFFFSKEQDLTI